MALDGLVVDLGVDWANQSDLSAELRISKNLAWKLSRVMVERDPMVALPLIPGPDAFEILIKKAAAQGSKLGSVETLRRAVQGLEDFAAQHAGDRASLELLAAGCASDQESSIAINHRKAAFTGNGFIWGVQASTTYKMCFLRESLIHPGLLDMCGLVITYALRKTRPVGSWLVARSRQYWDDAKGPPADGPRQPQALDPSVAGGQPHLVRQFCSATLPSVRIVQCPDGSTETWIEDWAVGDASALTIVTGSVLHGITSIHRTPQEPTTGIIGRLSTPAELYVMDMYVQRSVFAGATPTMRVVSDLGTPETTGNEDHRVLPIPCRVSFMGRGTKCAAYKPLPRCVEIADAALGWLGWSDHEFDLYRSEIRYPPIAASAVMDIALPE
jgi:hypothetical protein